MSENMPWLRLYVETVDDEKLRLLAFEDRWHFIALLCCKGKGILDEPNKTLMFRKVSVKLGLQLRELEEVARRLSEVGLVDVETLQPCGWNKRQFSSDRDPTNADRQRKYREKQKAAQSEQESRVTNALHNVTVTPLDTDTDIDTNVSIGHSDKPNAVSRVVVPYQKILDLYHEILPDNPPAIPSRWTINPAHKDLRNRWKEAERHQDMDFWQAFFIAVSKVPRWVEGIPSQNGGKPWRPDLPWLLRSRNFEKVLSEMVDNKRRNGHG